MIRQIRVDRRILSLDKEMMKRKGTSGLQCSNFLCSLEAVTETCFAAVCFCVQGDCTYACSVPNNFNSFSPRSAPSLCYVWNERRPSLAVPSADSRESRSLCGSPGGTKTFPLEELWVPVDKEGSVASPGRVYMLVYSTVGIEGAAEACTFQTTSGGCINSHPWRNFKGSKFLPMITISPA